MQTSNEISNVVVVVADANGDDRNVPKVDASMNESTNEVKSSEKSTRRSDLSLNIPPRHTHFGSSRSNKASLQSPGISSNGASSSRSIFRGISFKKKDPPDGESSSLLRPDINVPPPESPAVTNIKSTIYSKRCTSLPVKHGSLPSPSVATPISARTYSEQQKSQAQKGTLKQKADLHLSARKTITLNVTSSR
nr:RING/U-box superfamily protein [Tanacetum cinerariifolium]